MISEIGSEFWNVPVCNRENKLFPDNTTWYLSGRAALRAIITDIKDKIDFKRVALPSWCCESMITPFLEERIEVEFYSVCFENGTFKKEFSNISKCDAILLMDYFGFKRNFDICFDGIIINDITHSVFCGKFSDADYTFGSLRKWAGFYTGGFAFSKIGLLKTKECDTSSRYVALRKEAMKEKELYIGGHTDKKDYLEIFAKAEELLENAYFSKAYSEDIARAKKLDVQFIKQRRRENASVILEKFANLAIFPEIKIDDCPLFVPLLIPNGKRDELRKYLIDKKIYCPVHWPMSEYHNITSNEKTVYEQEISIICDQRYSISDMEFICQHINLFLGRM